MKDRLRKITFALAAILLLGNLLQAQPLQEHSQMLHPVQKNGRWGFIDGQGKQVIPFKYKSLTYGHFVNGYIAVVDSADRAVLLDGTGKQVLIESACPGVCSYGYYSGGRVPVTTIPMFGTATVSFRDLKGKSYSAPKANQAMFSSYTYFSDGLCLALSDSGVGYINTEAKLVIPVQYEWGMPFSKGRAVVREKGLFGIIDTKGAWVVKPQFQNLIYSAADGSYFGNNGLNWTRFDAAGKTIELYDEGLQLYAELPVLGKDEFLVYQRNGRFGFGTATGDALTIDTFQSVGYFSNGRAAIQTRGVIQNDPQGKPYLAGGWGYVNTKAEVVIDAVLDEVTPFVNGAAAVRYRGSWGFIDTAGNWLVQPSYTLKPEPFRGELAQIRIPDPNCKSPDCKDYLIGYVNRKGVVVWTPQR